MGTEKNIQIGIIIADIVLLALFLVGFYHITLMVKPVAAASISSISHLIIVYIISFLASYTFFPSLAQNRLIKSEDVILRVIYTCALMLLFITLIASTLYPKVPLPRSFLFPSMIGIAVLLTIERFTTRQILKNTRASKRNQKNVVLVGNEATVHRLFTIFNDPSNGFNTVGIFYDGKCEDEEMQKQRIGSVGDFYGWLTKHTDFDEIYGYFPREQMDTINMISKFCDNHLIRFYYIPAIDLFKGSISFSFVGDVPVIARREEPLRRPVNKFIKRLFDILFSALVIVLVFPWLLPIVAIIIKKQSPGKIFFLQKRTGLDGKVFNCIKFRSMRENSKADELQATENDPRKFPFGNFMRKTNIDELPQFINVLLGDMSVVGPRPHMLKHTHEYSRLINRFMVRHFAKPGITGLAQVSGFRGETRYIDQMEGRVKKDIEYIENWTFLLDLKIILKTVTNMLGREKGNAY